MRKRIRSKNITSFSLLSGLEIFLGEGQDGFGVIMVSDLQGFFKRQPFQAEVVTLHQVWMVVLGLMALRKNEEQIPSNSLAVDGVVVLVGELVAEAIDEGCVLGVHSSLFAHLTEAAGACILANIELHMALGAFIVALLAQEHQDFHRPTNDARNGDGTEGRAILFAFPHLVQDLLRASANQANDDSTSTDMILFTRLSCSAHFFLQKKNILHKKLFLVQTDQSYHCQNQNIK